MATPVSGRSGYEPVVFIATMAAIAIQAAFSLGLIDGVHTADIIARYPSVVTPPARYGFSISVLIWAAIAAYAVHRLRRPSAVTNVTPFFLAALSADVAATAFWHLDRPTLSFAATVAAFIAVAVLCVKVRDARDTAEAWIVKGAFGLWGGWLAVGVLCKLFAAAASLDLELSRTAAQAAGCVGIAATAAAGIWARVRAVNYFFPLAVAWALTAIGVGQSGRSTAIVLATAFGTIAGLIASLSVVMTLNSSLSESK